MACLHFYKIRYILRILHFDVSLIAECSQLWYMVLVTRLNTVLKVHTFLAPVTKKDLDSKPNRHKNNNYIVALE